MSFSRVTFVQRIRWELGDRPWEDSSLTAASASSTITGATTGYWVKGDIGEFIDDGDTFMVISETGGTITATRSYDGSTGAAHTSKRVLKNPRYRFNEITNAIESVIQDQLWPKVWKKVADTITPSSTATWYDLASDARGLINVRQLYGTSDSKEGLYGGRHSAHPVWFRRNMTTSLVASGVGLRFPAGTYHASNTINVDYAAKITDTLVSDAYADLADQDAVVEAIIFGAVSHLEGALENRKPRKPRQDRETLRGAALYDRRFRDALNRANQECKDTIPIMPLYSRSF